MSLYEYGTRFFAYQQHGALSSARALVPFVQRSLGVHSVLDVGCGAAAWTAAWVEQGLQDVIAIDAPYLRESELLCDPSQFRACDVSRPFDLGRRFDLVQCLEVAEHLDPSSSDTLVRNLVAHGELVLFSAAPPGQGGEHHVNERPYAWWRDAFDRHGYVMLDCIRPVLRDRADVEKWYRFNTFLFASRAVLGTLPAAIAATRVPAAAPVRDIAPLGWRLRCRMLAALSPATVSRLATFKHRLVLQGLLPASSR